MVRLITITLISDDPTAHGVFDTPTETRREVMAEVRSITRNEAYQARSLGLSPEIVFVISDYADYEGESRVLWNEIEYKVIRTYTGSRSGEREEEIELICERSNHHG